MRWRAGLGSVAVGLLLVRSVPAVAQPLPPKLTAPVNDFAHAIDTSSAEELDRRIRALQAATGDVVVVATVPTYQPYGDIKAYAVKMFENGGDGIGARGKDNGVLIVVAIEDRKVGIEVGYALEEYITDGFAGQTIREAILPEFRSGRYGRWAGRRRDAHHQPNRGCPRGEPAGRPTRRSAAAAAGPHSDRYDRLHSLHHSDDEPREAPSATVLGRAVERLEQRCRALRRRIRRRLRRFRRWGWRRRRLRRIRRRPQRRRWSVGRVVKVQGFRGSGVQGSRFRTLRAG